MTRDILSCVLALIVLGRSQLLAQVPIPDSLTVQQTVQLVLGSHPAVQQSSASIIAAGARVDQSRSSLYPQIAAAGSAVRTAPVPSLDVPGVGSFSLVPRMRYVAGLTASQTVWDFARRSTAVELARSRGDTAATHRDLVRSRLAFLTIDDFYAVLFLRRSLEVEDEQIDALNQHLAVIQQRVRTGVATNFDVLTTQVRVATARSVRIDVANQLDRKMIELRQLLGLPEDRPLALKGDFTLAAVGLDPDSLEAAALAGRPEVQLARQAEGASVVERRLATLGDRPSLRVGLQVGIQNGYVPNLETMKGNWNASVSVQVPVFDGRRTRSRVAEATARLDAAREHTRDVERRVATEVQQAAADVRASLAKLETSELQVQQAVAAVSLAETRYQAGVITNLEVLDAQTALSEARLLQLRAQYAFVRSRYELERAVGATPW
jgi:outer membrane protein